MASSADIKTLRVYDPADDRFNAVGLLSAPAEMILDRVARRMTNRRSPTSSPT
jgi:hypothetical protein